MLVRQDRMCRRNLFFLFQTAVRLRLMGMFFVDNPYIFVNFAW